MTGILVRKAVPTDHEQIERLLTSRFGNAAILLYGREYLDDERMMNWVAVQERKVVGYLHAGPDRDVNPNNIYLHLIAIARGSHAHGPLLEKLFKTGAASGAAHVSLVTMAPRDRVFRMMGAETISRTSLPASKISVDMRFDIQKALREKKYARVFRGRKLKP